MSPTFTASSWSDNSITISLPYELDEIKAALAHLNILELSECLKDLDEPRCVQKDEEL
jgi:hypothetical protein